MISDFIEPKVKTRPSVAAPEIRPNQAVSFVMSFESVKHIVASSPPLRRPNRTKPIHDPDLMAELEAWDAASDEALENADHDMME
jgi:hypothetical protein